MKNRQGIVWAPVLIMISVVIIAGVAGYFMFQATKSVTENTNVAVVNQANENVNTNSTVNTNQVTNNNSGVNTNSTANTNTVSNTNATVNTNTSTVASKKYEGPFLVTIEYPGKYTLEKNTENNRRGSYETWNIIPQENAPYLQELQIFRRDTVEAFNNRCNNLNTLCFEGDYPTVERFDGFMQALQNRTSYQDYQFITLGTENYLVKDNDAVGEGGKIREYNTSIGGVTLITIWAYIPDSSFDTRADAQVEPWQVGYAGY